MVFNTRSFVLTVTLCLVLAGLAAADGVSCVLLHNGNVMTGRVSRSGGRVLLSNVGSQLWLEESAIAHEAATLEEVYQWKRAAIKRPTVNDHLRLASWCLEQRLMPQASRELLEARVADPTDRRVAVLERRLFESSRPRQSDPAVRPASYEAPVLAPARAPATTSAAIESLPPGVAEQFVRRVQPILVNNCTAGGCHQGTGPEEFILDRSLLHGQGDHRTTHANLTAVLEYIDRHDPAASTLLNAAQRPHAGRTTPAFTGRHAALEAHLVAWVNSVCRPEEQAGSDAARAEQSGGVFGLVKAQHERDRFVDSVEQRVKPHGARDEFDPALFNRRYGTKATDGQ
ncbi:hypothetical protein Pla123a_42830 [Posidoniimonas polymericola]|uniref:Uncharacterized protein n=1 Tax=Posidoniimonas polymericola TaxID=2528002 RepID=A0A5C5XWJ9_9BACT|nr:hypothetical protein [Posidoniimonas polymericola]TWT67727.1 hypothetical protein Pla123a_42830 [Posidoniimonas polymericola]